MRGDRMTPTRRPGPLPVLLLAFFAAAMVWSFATGHLNRQWTWWLAAFLVMELWAALTKTPGATLSERTWAWMGVRPHARLRLLRAPICGAFMLELGAHFVTGGTAWWSGGVAVVSTAAPLSLVIGYSLLFEGRARGTP